MQYSWALDSKDSPQDLAIHQWLFELQIRCDGEESHSVRSETEKPKQEQLNFHKIRGADFSHITFQNETINVTVFIVYFAAEWALLFQTVIQNSHLRCHDKMTFGFCRSAWKSS